MCLAQLKGDQLSNGQTVKMNYHHLEPEVRKAAIISLVQHWTSTSTGWNMTNILSWHGCITPYYRFLGGKKIDIVVPTKYSTFSCACYLLYVWLTWSYICWYLCRQTWYFVFPTLLSFILYLDCRFWGAMGVFFCFLSYKT